MFYNCYWQLWFGTAGLLTVDELSISDLPRALFLNINRPGFKYLSVYQSWKSNHWYTMEYTRHTNTLYIGVLVYLDINWTLYIGFMYESRFLISVLTNVLIQYWTGKVQIHTNIQWWLVLYKLVLYIYTMYVFTPPISTSFHVLIIPIKQHIPL